MIRISLVTWFLLIDIGFIGSYLKVCFGWKLFLFDIHDLETNNLIWDHKYQNCLWKTDLISLVSIRLCLVPGKYKGKKKNAKESDFLMFGCPMKNIKENQI